MAGTKGSSRAAIGTVLVLAGVIAAGSGRRRGSNTPVESHGGTTSRPATVLRVGRWRRIRLLAVADIATYAGPIAAAFALVLALTVISLRMGLDGPSQLQRDWVVGVAAGVVSGMVLLVGTITFDLPRELNERQSAADRLALWASWASAAGRTDDAQLLSTLEVFLANHGRLRYERTREVVSIYRRTGDLEEDAQGILGAFSTSRLVDHTRRAADAGRSEVTARRGG